MNKAFIKIKQFYGVFIALLFLIILYITNLIFLYSTDTLIWGESIGFENMFYSVVMTFNTFVFIFAPIIPLITIVTFESDIVNFNGKKIKFILQEFLKSIRGGLVFFLGELFMLLIFVIFYPNSSPRLQVMGLFSSLYSISPILYICAYIVHSFVFGWIFAFFGRAILLITQNIYNTLIIGFIVYRFQNFLPPNWAGLINLLPFYPYEFSSLSLNIGKNIYDLALILIASIFLIARYFSKIEKLRSQMKDRDLN